MPTRILLDCNIISKAVNPKAGENKLIASIVSELLLDAGYRVLVPEIIDYEVRRKLLHLKQDLRSLSEKAATALALLDGLAARKGCYVPLDTPTMHLAAQFWAEMRIAHQPG